MNLKLAAMNGKQITCQTSKHSDRKEKATLIYLSFRTGSVVFEAHLASVGRCIGEGDVATARSVNCKLTSRFAGFQILKRNKQSLPLIMFLISWCSSGRQVYLTMRLLLLVRDLELSRDIKL